MGGRRFHAEVLDPGKTWHATRTMTMETAQMTTIKTTLYVIAGLLGTAALAPAACAQAYPTKPVKFIVPHPGGGGPLDAPGRGLAESLAKTLGQPFVVENRDGAQGIIGTDAVVKSDPDGYTLLFTSSSVITLNGLVRANLPYNSERDLAPVAYVGAINSLLMVNPSVPAKNLKELIALAKAKPNSLSWGTLGTTSSGPLLIGWFRKHTGAQFYMIPYKSTVQALMGTVAGDVKVVTYAVGQGSKLVKAGKLRALAVIGSKRSEELPDVPTSSEMGVDLNFRNWIGLFAPKKTPHDVIARLNSATNVALKDPVYEKKYLNAVGVTEDEMSGSSPEKFAQYIAKDREAYQEAVEAAGIKKQ
jgi:tripartite-type tricarboxylate transporter receptor subunit TctC